MEDEYRTSQLIALKKSLFCGICFLVLAVILIVTGSLTPETIQKIIVAQAKTST